MKHVACISCRKPAKADEWQDVLCAVVSVLSAIIEAFGGSSPIVGLVDSKCAMPTPNPTDTGTT